MTKTNLFAASLAVIAFAAFGSSEARADATAIADINITSATLSGPGVASIGSPAFTNQLSSEAGLGPVGGAEVLSTSSTGGLVSVGSVPTNYSSGFATLTGSLLTPTGAASESNSQTTVLNGYYSNSGQAHSGTSASFIFTAQTNSTITLTISGTATNYAHIYNTTNFAQTSATSNTTFTVTLTDASTGAKQQFAPSALNISDSALGVVQTSGSTTAVAFSNLTNVFNLIGGDTYSFTISQTASAQDVSVPEPGALALFGTGMVGFGLLSARRRKNNAA